MILKQTGAMTMNIESLTKNSIKEMEKFLEILDIYMERTPDMTIGDLYNQVFFTKLELKYQNHEDADNYRGES